MPALDDNNEFTPVQFDVANQENQVDLETDILEEEEEDIDYDTLTSEYKAYVNVFQDQPRHTWTEEQKLLFIKRLRFQFCNRKKINGVSMICKDGTMNLKYFETKFVETQAKKWTHIERQLLIQGIEIYGIGGYAKMIEEMLPGWTVNHLRVKTIGLMGRQNLSKYAGWKGDEEAITREFERNKAIGLATGCWKGTCLVTDDAGKVLKMIEETENK